MAYGDIGAAVIDSVTFLADHATQIMPRKVTDGIVAIFYRNSTLFDAIVETRAIDATGHIGAVINTLTYDANMYGLCTYVQEVSHGVFISAVRTNAGVMKIYTIGIADDGTITGVINSLVTALSVPNVVDYMCKKPGVNLFVMAWQHGAAGCDMATFTCNDDGTGIALKNSWIAFVGANYTSPTVKWMSGSIFAVTYRDNATMGWIGTLTIADDGTITAALIDTQSISGATTNSHSAVLRLLGTLVAVGYQSFATLDGIIGTYTIDAGGNISAQIDNDTFEGLDGGMINLISLGADAGVSYVLVYYTETSADIGKLVSYSVNGVGTLTPIDSLSLTLAGATGSTHGGDMIRQDIWSVGLVGSPGSTGVLKTISIVTAPPLPTGPTGASGAHLRGRIGRRLMMG
jgi:hypothetical protein